MRFFLLCFNFSSADESVDFLRTTYAFDLKEAHNKAKEAFGIPEDEKTTMTSWGNMIKLELIRELSEPEFLILDKYVPKII